MVKYQEERLTDVFVALADPTRRSMARSLAEGEKTLSALAAPLPMTMPAVLKHIAVMERSGIVVTEKRGRVRWCRLQPQPLSEAQAWLQQTAEFWTERLSALQRFLEESE